MATQTLRFEQFIQATPEAVTHALTNASLMRYWLCDVATVDPRPGGRIYLAWNRGYFTAGEYTVVEPGHQVGFTWCGRNDPGRSQVLAAITPQNGGAHLVLEHSLPADDAAWQKTGDEMSKGWRNSLENLASVLETGQDLRFVNRPMLGITFSDFNPEIAAELGVPVSEGVRLDFTLESMGAYAAGLRGGDVVTQVGAIPIQNFSDFQTALSGKRAGQVVPVSFYRGPEKRTVDMTLSRRPLPDIPATTLDLAREIRKRYDETEARLEEFLSGINDTEADFRPSPEEWTVKEILAHLLQSERFGHFHVSEVATGYENWNDGWGGNLSAQVRATVAAFPTLAELVDQLKRMNRETVALFESLPPDFTNTHKAGYWSLAYGALEAPYHLVTHMEQMSRAVEAARNELSKV